LIMVMIQHSRHRISEAGTLKASGGSLFLPIERSGLDR